MKLYHGSTEDITKIDLSKSKPNKDFGRGFYLSAEKEQAEKLAEYKAFQFGGEHTQLRYCCRPYCQRPCWCTST